jgi:hypothetical protein
MGTIVVRQAGGHFPSICPRCSENSPHALLLVACHQPTRLGRLVLNSYRLNSRFVLVFSNMRAEIKCPHRRREPFKHHSHPVCSLVPVVPLDCITGADTLSHPPNGW